MSYLVVDLVFLALAAALAALLVRRARRRPGPWAAILAGGAVLLVLTAAFDNVLILLGLYAYAPSALTGLFLGAVPIEDFAYPIVAAVLVPLLWRALTARQAVRSARADERRRPEDRRRAPGARALRTEERP
ncbi:lycopene cyclase domain-containing protein [Sinomonas atrocyanea]|uniref:lycopene cyclase domain-containing protein n=1 Tax=Sinomonas atrocyanea TaxID=37927 RepID=UPI002785F228|nr:lycopene cyclase domain-containing protein [Sinomonas atrocyanea]MDQ0260821.1 lycopene cyclase domain-containing protein [Sinomonas atrocyanea]MDR6622196.1 lycopene cyclase domain-containing protein [Sinomonas atrocyanea]